MSEHRTRPGRDTGGGDAAGPSDTGRQTGDSASDANVPAQKPGEIGGPKGPEPTRYGDWEVGGRCTDF